MIRLGMVIHYSQQLIIKVQMEASNFEKVKVLGEGTYGKCYLVLDRTKNELCVLKQIEIMGMSQEEIDQAVRQAHILQSLSHPCIVKFLGQFQSAEGYLNIVMSYADGGDLSQKIKEVKLKQQAFAESQIVHWFVQVCLAIQHVHERKIIHRDIKSQNIFLTKQGNVKLGDFGIARPLQLTLQKIKSVVGTPYYMSPEICQNKEYSFKTDIWSLGVILLEMCLLKPPFDANSLPALALKISKGEYTPVPKQYSKGLKQLVAEMMQVDPAKRPTINEVLSSPLLRDRANFLRFKDKNDSDCSQSFIQEISLVKKSSNSSRGLYLDLNVDEHSPMDRVISPKNQLPKHHDMPVKRVDNYMKEPSKIDKKSQKKGEQLRRKQVSQPTLTPKGHSKIQNDRKVMVKNNSQINFQKKKPAPTSGCFKKKTKCSQDIVKSLEEIHEVKNDIYSLQGQISHREKQPSPPMNIAQLDSQDNVSCPEQTPLQTLEQLIQELTSQSQFEEMYKECEAEKGICSSSPMAGLMTLAYGFRNFELSE